MLQDFKQLSLNKRALVFRDWLANKNPEETYVYWEGRECLLAQFGNYIMGTKNNALGGYNLFWPGSLSNEGIVVIPLRDDQLSPALPIDGTQQSFGQALSRLDEIIKSFPE